MLVGGFVSAYAAQIPTSQEVRPGVHVIVGDLGPQRYENEGLNANLGFVIGADAVVVLNSGPSRRMGDAVLSEIRRRTEKPVRWVINLNSQNQYWWGNAAFEGPGTTFIAHTEAIRIMREQVEDQRKALSDILGERFSASEPVFPTQAVNDRLILDLGNRPIHIMHLGAAHTPGDLAVWLPRERVLFAGDIVYTERLPAVLPLSRTKTWVNAFKQIDELKPDVVIPGHGRPTMLSRAREHTLEYLRHLRSEAKRLFEAGMAPNDAPNRIDQSRWRALVNYQELHRRNADLVFLEVERELF